jgi:uncharacterized protein (DUF924 family)
MASAPSHDPCCADVLAFWFGGSGDDAHILEEKGALWFRAGASVDADIRARFGALHAAAVAGELDGWLASPRGRLALVILVDQFSRNLYRDDARAFAHDALARRWCDDGLAHGADRDLRAVERVFFYLPLEHSESIADQQHSVTLFERLRDVAPPPLRERFDDFFDYAVRHREVILRFGRFPHRNRVLGRASTPAEIEFLAQPGSSF